MYTPQERERLRDILVRAARDDDRIQGAALTGSAARDAEDDWSDIDLAVGLAAGADRDAVLADWTTVMYREHGAVHHTDVRRRDTIYRVFLLVNTLQVDVAFAPDGEFGAIAPTFRLLFGTATPQEFAREPDADALIGMAWLYALHARSSLARGRRWQAEYMISGLRDQVLALACKRHGVPAVQGRGMDDLPAEILVRFSGALPRSLDDDELVRAFRVAVDALLVEAGEVDAALVARLSAPLRELAWPTVRAVDDDESITPGAARVGRPARGG